MTSLVHSLAIPLFYSSMNDALTSVNYRILKNETKVMNHITSFFISHSRCHSFSSVVEMPINK